MHAPTRALLVPMVAALAGSFTGFAVADPADTGGGTNSGDRGGVLEEVVVTAEKRSSTVQDTPISMTAVTGDLMQQQGITNLNGIIQSVPGISVRTAGPGQTELEMRGMSSS